MEPIGIESIINRINQIEARFNNIEGKSTVSFQDVLNVAKDKENSAKPVQNYNYNLPSLPGMYSFQSVAGANSPLNYQQMLTFPDSLVQYNGYQMTQGTARSFSQLEQLIGQHFPGRAVTITSTTDGKHTDPNHSAGKAVDFVVDGLTKDESVLVEELARQSGFTPYNEYIHSSPYKTGDHMHVDLSG